MNAATLARRYDRLLMPAKVSNQGGFSHEAIYYIKLANGTTLEHVGFTSYTFDATKRRNPDANWDGIKQGFVEVILYKNEGATCLVEPPQCHGGDHSGLVCVNTDDLLLVPRSQWYSHNHYATGDSDGIGREDCSNGANGTHVVNNVSHLHPCG